MKEVASAAPSTASSATADEATVVKDTSAVPVKTASDAEDATNRWLAIPSRFQIGRTTALPLPSGVEGPACELNRIDIWCRLQPREAKLSPS